MGKKRIVRRMTVRYFLSVIFPMLVMNGASLLFIQSNEDNNLRNEMEKVAEKAIYELNRNVDDAVSVSDYLYMSSELNRFLEESYVDGVEYYERFNQLLKDNVIRYYYTAQSVYRITVITDNGSITNGAYFMQEDEVKNQDWYREFIGSGQNIALCTNYNDNPYMRYFQRSRHISILRSMDVRQGHAVLKLDVDYTKMLQNIFHDDQDVDIYICKGDRIIFSNLQNDASEDFQAREAYQKKDLEAADRINLYGEEWEVLVTAKRQGFFSGFERNGGVTFLLILFDISFPLIAFTLLIQIGQEKQELELEKKQAELNALQSQMNPHFMFNTLESIRMNSMLNGEEETEQMLGKFSLLLRQASQWDRDFISIGEEMEFVKSYLEIQKFRFGDQMAYEILVEEACKEYMIPKFGILTFVENACVHGVEKKSQGGTVLVKVRSEGKEVRIQVEDQGAGMEQEQLEYIRERIRHASMEDLKESSHVGMLNAVLRLKAYCEGNVDFEIGSVKGEGTKVGVRLRKMKE